MAGITHISVQSTSDDLQPIRTLACLGRSTSASLWRIPGARGPVASANMTAPTERFMTFYFMPAKTQWLSSVLMDVAIGAAGSTGQFLIYRTDRFGNPDRSEIVANGSIDTATAGTKETVLPHPVQIVESQMYAFSFLHSGGGDIVLETATYLPLTFSPGFRVDAANWYGTAYVYSSPHTAHTITAATIPAPTTDVASTTGLTAFALFGFGDLPAETQHPVVRFTAPDEGATNVKAGATGVTAEILDASDIKRVEYEIRDVTGTTMWWNGTGWQSTFILLDSELPNAQSKVLLPFTAPASSDFLVAIYAEDEWGNRHTTPAQLTFSTL